jgi:hypothetical protein
MKITLEPVGGEYSLFREQYDQLIVDLRRQRLDVHLSLHRIEPQPAQADPQTPWDLIVRVGDVADAVAAIASITYAIRSRLRATGPHSGSSRRAIIYFPRNETRAFHALQIPTIHE